MRKELRIDGRWPVGTASASHFPSLSLFVTRTNEAGEQLCKLFQIIFIVAYAVLTLYVS